MAVGRLLVWKRTPPVWLNLTWRNLTPAWPTKRIIATLGPGGSRAAKSNADALPRVKLATSLAEKLDVKPGQEVHVTSAAFSWFGLRSFRAEVAKGSAATGQIEAPPKVFQAAGLTKGAKVIVERVA